MFPPIKICSNSTAIQRCFPSLKYYFCHPRPINWSINILKKVKNTITNFSLFCLNSGCYQKCVLTWVVVSGNRSTVFVTLAVLLVGVSTALSIPSGKTDWWLDPCDTQLPLMRHPRSANVQQIFYSINDIKQLKKKLIEIYPNVS